MATLVGGFGTSHSPMLLADPVTWGQRGGHDRRMTDLRDENGTVRSWGDLAAAAAGRFADDLTVETWEERFGAAQRALDRIGEDIRAADPAAVVVVGDDQHELFDDSIQPVLGVYWGERWRTDTMHERDPDEAAWFQRVAAGWAMDDRYEFPGEPTLGVDIVSGLVEQGFDVTSLARMPQDGGFGHAYGFVKRRFVGDKEVPIVPILLNTYFPPNQPTAARCYDLGVALAAAIEASSFKGTVLVGASGGLSHFVVNEDLDRQLMDALNRDDADALRGLPQSLLHSGTSEIRNWIVTGGAMQSRSVDWSEYIPAYRSAAGTGVGLAFAVWK